MVEGNYNYGQFWLQAIRDVRDQLHALGHIARVLKDDEYRPSLVEDDRRELFSRWDGSYSQLDGMLVALSDLSNYGTMDRLERKDKVLINQLCRELAKEKDVEVLYKSDIPDYYAVTTNAACLKKVISILLSHAVTRTLFRKEGLRERLVFLNVTERGERGKLTFAVSDTGDPTTSEEDMELFEPPAGRLCQPISSHLGIFNCWLMVRLLGGFVYVDPAYRNGRRFVFSIAL